MPRNEHLVLCGGLDVPRKGSVSSLSLSLHGTSPNLRLQIADISRRLLANIPDVLVDLLEVASYIYAADSAVPRGGTTDAKMGARWRRKFRFVIPVRLPDLWSSDAVSSALVETLSFLSEDDYEFEFRPLKNPPTVTNYFEFPDAEGTAFTPDEVILFSGGLDSFAGTVEQLDGARQEGRAREPPFRKQDRRRPEAPRRSVAQPVWRRPGAPRARLGESRRQPRQGADAPNAVLSVYGTRGGDGAAV